MATYCALVATKFLWPRHVATKFICFVCHLPEKMMSLVEFDSFWLHFIHDVAFFSCVLSRGCEENMTGLLAFVEFVFHLA